MIYYVCLFVFHYGLPSMLARLLLNPISDNVCNCVENRSSELCVNNNQKHYLTTESM